MGGTVQYVLLHYEAPRPRRSACLYFNKINAFAERTQGRRKGFGLRGQVVAGHQKAGGAVYSQGSAVR